MEIDLVNYNWIILIIYIMIINIISESEICHVKYYDYLNKQSTDCLKGLSVLIVIFHHIALFSKEQNIYYTIFKNTGFLAVSIFLFVSGYGLMLQKITKQNYLQGILFKMVKLYITFFVCNIIVTILSNTFLETKYTIKDIIKSSLYANFTDGRELWFVVVILFLYLSFYLSFKIFDDKVAFYSVMISPIIYALMCILLKKGSWWYNTVITFNLGVFFAIYKKEIFKKLNKHYYIYLVLSLVMFIFFMLKVNRFGKLQFLIPIIFIILIGLLLMKINLKSKIMSTFSKISFEMYLLHMIILNIAFETNNKKSSAYIIILLIIITLLSIIVQNICNILFNKIYKKNKLASKIKV